MIQTAGIPPRIALIGVSGYAEVYIDWLLEAHRDGSIRMAAATILPNERKLPSAVALQAIVSKIYDSYEDMCAAEAGKLDICFIPTGIQWHAPMAIAALKAGCNVLVEKPLAGSIADVDRVRAAEKQYDKWIAVGFQDMYTAEILQLKQSLLNGIIGKIQSVSMIGAWPRPVSYYERNQWAGKLEVNGSAVMDSPLNNAFAHFVNLSLFLAGEELRASVNAKVDQAELFHAHDIESFDTAVVQATAENGVSLWFGVTHASAETIEPRIRIVGERGSVVWEHEKDCTIFADSQEPVTVPVPRYGQTRKKMFENVIARLAQSSTPICDTLIAKSHTCLIEGIHKNAEIAPIHPDLVEAVNIGTDKQSIPAIKEIGSLLERAFETGSGLGDLSVNAVQAER
ncbi:Gfo/Idh/MocA family oxidoreductase [Pelagicoccus sp. SDUM812005]|uniref:Gfo/Idh/MocA family protein n=1 Tax=Pelagicoccus sp. SDUM812005 TaxID=3041257 RepID=UPI00280CE91B|nr:Gfo/Idh/MocA family oxidoreductase [Pelagicoccus sp. SDUM812005]MDQ8181683.1 Gfo/Idh/MocA family oxidoreductase [Pelagicoccus sp. SDUM812005]